ncbi:MAG: ferritin [Bacteroidales bacterium]|jgi:ferritin|nr:ferritin [Bacteroidales bacterium]
MLKKKVEDICNRQIEREGYSSNLYLAMAVWAETKGFEGTAGWLYAQADEEREHMLKLIKFVNDRGGTAIVPAFEKPPVEFENVQSLFEEVLKHEEFITESINEMVELTIAEKDYTTHNFLQWYVAEQIEEESTAKGILDKLNMGGKHNLYPFDRDLMRSRTEK